MTPTASSPAPSSRLRSLLIWTTKVVVSAGLLYVLLSRVDLAHLWLMARTASPMWLGAALVSFFAHIVLNAWRWGLLLDAQQVPTRFGALLNSYLVATFFNNFLPSNIGGDVVRIRDTARPAGSKTLATTIVLIDRGIGLLGLVFVAAVGATLAAHGSEGVGPVGPGLLWLGLAAGFAGAAVMVLAPQALGWMLKPLAAFHQEWVGERIQRLTSALTRFRSAPGALTACFAGAILVQAVLVAFYAAIARALSIPVPFAHLAILIPLSFIVQMLPLSVNGFGVRETTFTLYFARLHLPAESALALSFIGAALVMLASTTGAVAYLGRRRTEMVPAG